MLNKEAKLFEIGTGSSIKHDSLLLITGANGFVGVTLIRRLLDAGYQKLRCLVRSTRNRERLDVVVGMHPSASVEIMLGNLLVFEDCKRAVKVVTLIYHLAAGRGKSFAGCVLDSAVATRNLLKAAADSPQLKRFVNVSSFSVYSNYGMRRGSLTDWSNRGPSKTASRSTPIMIRSRGS